MSGAGPKRSTFTTALVFAGSSWVRLGLTFVVGLVVTWLLLRTLKADLFGLYMLISLTISSSDPLYAVVNKATNRELTAAHSSGDAGRMRRVFTNGVILAALASMATALLPIALAILAPVIFTYDPADDLRVRLALITEGVVIVSLVLSMPVMNLYLATQRIVLENAFRVAHRVLDLAAVALAFAMPFDPFMAFVVTRMALTVGLLGARGVIILRLTPAARFSWRERDAGMVKGMAKTGGWAFGEFVGRFGLWDVDHLLFNIFFGPVFNAINSIVNQVRGYTRLLGVNMLFGVEAIAADLHERGRAETLRRVLIATTAKSFAVVGFCCVVTAAFFGPLLDVWLGSTLRADAALAAVMTYEQARTFAWVFMLIGLPGVLFGEGHTSAAMVLYGMGKIRSYAPVVMAASALRLGTVAALLAAGSSAYVMAWGTTAVLTVVYGGYFPWLIARNTGMALPRFWAMAYGRGLVSLAPVGALAWWMSGALAPWSIVKIALACGALAAVYAPLAYFLVLDASERERVWTLGRHVLSRVGMVRSRGAEAHAPTVDAGALRAADEADANEARAI